MGNKLMQTETEELKQSGFVGYRLENDIYSMVDFKTGDILHTMDEVSLLFDGTILLKHGRMTIINERLKYMSEMYRAFGIPHDLHIVKGKIPVEELDKMLTVTGYLPSQVKGMIGMVG